MIGLILHADENEEDNAVGKYEGETLIEFAQRPSLVIGSLKLKFMPKAIN